MKIPVKDFTFHQLINVCKLFYEFIFIFSYFCDNYLYIQISTAENRVFNTSDTQDNQPFETLKNVLEKVKPDCGINVEIKYPMKKRVSFLLLLNEKLSPLD
jgi:hypothetical protein